MTTPALWLTAAAIAGLPGVPRSERRTRDWLARIGVPRRQAAGRTGGGGIEWDCSALPAETRAALLARQLQTAATAECADAPQLAPDRKPGLPATRPTTAVAAPAPSTRVPSRHEAECADARLAILNHAYALQQPGRTLDACFGLVVHQLASATAPADLLALASAANQRTRLQAAGPVSSKTLWKWHGKHQATGWAGLLPAPVLAKPLAALPDDVAAVLARYHSTSGAARNLSMCAQAVNTELGRPHDAWVALAHRARRALPKVDKVGLIKARHAGAERDAKLPYKRRDTGVLVPNDVWLIDGHTFKAKVRHPFHGQPFAPEVTVVIDAADRYIVGWSISLSENTIAVGDAVRVAVTRAGTTPAMIYSDGGSGETGKQLDCPIAGIYNRLGISHPVGLPGKPQGHGLIERSWRTTMIRCARQYGSYQGGDADSHTVRNVRLELAREATAVKRALAEGTVVRLSAKVPGWQQFMADVAAEVERYNTTHRHRGLPKHTSGPLAGKHMTPAEARAAMQQPIDPVLRIDHSTALHLFMPAMVRTPSRGWVQLENKQYYSEALMAYGVDGERCRVHYDIHDPGKVWVWTLGGDFVCEAGLEANTIDYMPLSALELAKERRVKAAVKRLQTKMDLAQAELAPQLQAPAAPVVFTAPLPTSEPVPALAEPAIEPAAELAATADPHRPAFFADSAERYEWLMQHPGQWAEGDATWLTGYAASSDYAALAGYYDSRGIAWPDEGESPGFNRAG